MLRTTKGTLGMTGVVQEKGRIAKSLGQYWRLGDPTENRFDSAYL